MLYPGPHSGTAKRKRHLRSLPGAWCRTLYLTSSIFCLLSSALLWGQSAREFRVAVVQFRIEPASLSSMEAYRSHVQALVERSLAFRPDLIIFPEYTSVFLALIPYAEAIRQSQSIEEGLRRISRKDPLVHDFRDLFLLNSGIAERAAKEIFGGLAQRYAVAIVAGTYFAWEGEVEGVRLTNRALVFDRQGRLAHVQDKVFLTEFEESLLGISPGRLDKSGPFLLEGRRIGLTICRDTFFEQWESQLAGSELWVDIKANGVPFTLEEQERFLRALPARLRSGSVPYGITVSLTGRLLDLGWEGESSFIARTPSGEVEFLARASSPYDEEIILATVPGQP